MHLRSSIGRWDRDLASSPVPGGGLLTGVGYPHLPSSAGNGQWPSRGSKTSRVIGRKKKNHHPRKGYVIIDQNFAHIPLDICGYQVNVSAVKVVINAKLDKVLIDTNGG